MFRAPQSRANICSSFPVVGVTLIGGSPAAALARSASSRTGSPSRRCPPRYESTAAHKSVFIQLRWHPGTLPFRLKAEATWHFGTPGTLAPLALWHIDCFVLNLMPAPAG